MLAALPAAASSKRAQEPAPLVSQPAAGAPRRLDPLALGLDPARPAAPAAMATELKALPPAAIRGAANDATIFAAAGEGKDLRGEAAPDAVAAALDKRFDNAFHAAGEVRQALGFNPAAASGPLLSDPVKTVNTVRRVRGPDGVERVVKISSERTIQNEMFVRGVLEAFPFFSAHLGSPRAVAYRRMLRDPVMVMEYVRASDTRKDVSHLPMEQKAALAALAMTFGIGDVNGGAAVDVGWERSVLIDFERARDDMPSHAHAPIAERPWISLDYVNDYADYAAAVSLWKAEFAKPATQAKLLELLGAAGVSVGQAKKDLALFRHNVQHMEERLKSDIFLANQRFLKNAASYKLDEREARVLGEINRVAQRSPESGAARDVVRWLIAPEGLRGSFTLRPAELRALKRLNSFSAERRAELSRAAAAGEVRDFDGKPIPSGRALETFDKLARMLR